MKSKNKRIVRYKKPFNINIGIIIFSFIFLYIGISTILYLTRDKISIYEVAKGQAEQSLGISGTGLAVRNEQVSVSPSSGYINYYVKEGTRVSLSSILYTIDESGTVSQMLETAAQNDTTLTADNISNIKYDISQYIKTYNSSEFSDIYEFKYNLNASLLEYVNINALTSINQSLQEAGNSAFAINTSATSGIVEFYTDGLEGVTVDTVTADMFDKDKYTKKSVTAGSLIEANTPIYKTISSESWQILIPLTDEQVNVYADTSIVKVNFPSENLTTSCFFSISNINGVNYGILSLKRYMMQFADSRYVDIKIMADTVEGLKVPKSAVVEKEFYKIPTEYLVSGGDSKGDGFNKEVLDSNGNSSVVFTPCDIYCKTDDYCYVETTTFSDNDLIVKPDSASKYQIKERGTLSGVYNVNTGYTTFRYIEILSDTNGYYIVKSGNRYGLQVYDQIVLNAKLVKEGQEIFR